ncbi:MAG: hypothetical protein AAGF92_00850 [Myxococcota bacterium]
MPNDRIGRKSRRPRARVQFDPHYFIGFVRGGRVTPRSARSAGGPWVRYDITLEDVLEDLTYGQD